MSLASFDPGSISAYRPDVDGLRAIAVLGVLVFHAGATWLPGGFVGVDVFFVISGYLITAIIARECDRGDFSYARFYERRIRRIYPALMVVLAATAMGAWAVMVPTDFRAFGRTLVWTPLFASNFAFMGQAGYFDPDGSVKPLLHTWSLGVEEQFYIVFPIVLLGAMRFGLDRGRLLAGLVAGSLATSVVAGLLGYGDGYFLLPIRFWELGFGALLATLPRRPASASARSALGVAGLAAILVSMVAIDESMPFPGWVALVPVLGATAVIASARGPAQRLLASAPMVFVGRISYPMYLWHWPLIVFTQIHAFHPLTPLEAVGVVAATVVLSWVTLVVIETPIRSRAVLGSRRALFAAAAVATAMAVALGLLAFNLKGLNRWTSADQAAIAAAAQEAAEIDELCPEAGRFITGEAATCRIGLRGEGAPAPSFAVIGDSHARVVAGAISTVAARAGLSGLYFGRVACPPLLGIDRIGDPELRCAEHLRRSLAEIERAGVGTVLVVSRWAVFTTGHDYGRSPAEVHPLVRDGRRVPEADRLSVVRAGLAATLDRLGGRDVVLVDSIPEARFDVPNTLANARRLGRTEPAGPSRAEFEHRQASVRALLSAVTANRPRTRVVSPAAALCDAEACRIVEAERPLYMDADHVSRFGATRLEPILAEALAPSAR